MCYKKLKNMNNNKNFFTTLQLMIIYYVVKTQKLALHDPITLCVILLIKECALLYC